MAGALASALDLAFGSDEDAGEACDEALADLQAGEDVHGGFLFRDCRSDGLRPRRG